MKISRSYLLGLGSGLILSALIAMVVPPLSINFGGALPVSQVSPNEDVPNVDNQGNEASQGRPGNPGESINLDSKGNQDTGGVQDPSENSGMPGDTKLFTIPSGSTADRIADLLLAEEWVSSKEEFLDIVVERNLASRFRAGSFELTQSMNMEEILEQLVP